jgi:hypothetical protein
MSDGSFKPTPPIKIDSLFLKDKDYARILKTIKDMAPHAAFDDLSDLIISGQIKTFEIVRPVFYFVVISLLIMVFTGVGGYADNVDPLEYFRPSGGKKL